MKKYILATIIALALFFAYNIFLFYDIRDLSVDGLQIQGKSYSVTYGTIRPLDGNYLQVIHLARFYRWVKESPLFLSPSLDPKKLKDSAEILDKIQRFTLRKNQYTAEVFPTHFLFGLSDLEKTYSNFLKTPSDNNAEGLLTVYQAVTASYLSSATDLKKEIAKSPKEKYARTPYVFITIATTPKTVEEDLDTIIQNGKQINQTVARLNWCLKGVWFCQAPSRDFQPPKGQPDRLQSPAPLPLPVLFGKEDIEQRQLQGPFGVKTACLGFGNGFSTTIQYYYLYTSASRYITDSDLPVIRAKVIDQTYFRRLNPKNSKEKGLIDQGIFWNHQFEANTYLCPDLGYFPTLTTIARLATQKPQVFQKAHAVKQPDQVLKNLFTKGAKLEEVFGQYPNEDNLNLLSSYYAYAYKQTNNTLRSHNKQKDESWYQELQGYKEQFLKAHLETKGKMADFDLLLNHLSQDFLILGLTTTQENFKYDPYYLYGLRSAYNLTYLTFSDLAWKLADKPKFWDRTVVKNALGQNPYQGFMTYSQAVKILTAEELEQLYIKEEKDKVLLKDLSEQ